MLEKNQSIYLINKNHMSLSEVIKLINSTTYEFLSFITKTVKSRE